MIKLQKNTKIGNGLTISKLGKKNIGRKREINSRNKGVKRGQKRGNKACNGARIKTSENTCKKSTNKKPRKSTKSITSLTKNEYNFTDFSVIF